MRKEFFESIIQKNEGLIEHSTKNSGLVLQGVELMEYDINKITINRVGSYIESPEWLKSKKCTINPQNKNDNKYLQYSTTVALNHEKINNHPEKISKVRPFTDEYSWTEIDFPSNQKDWKKFECFNKSIENWHYLCVKRLSALLRGISSNHNGDVYCMNCFKAFRTKSKLEVHKKCVKIMITVISKCLMKKMKYLNTNKIVIYYYLECLLEKTKEKYKSHKNQNACYICNKEFTAYDEDKNYYKAENYCKFTGKYQSTCHKICKIKYTTLKEIPIIFHSGSNFDYHFIINQLATSFKAYGSFQCLGEISEKHVTFSVPFKTNKSMTCELKFIDSFRFMGTSLSNLINNLSDQLYTNCFDCKNPLDYMVFKDNKVVLRCFECKKIISEDFNNELTERFKNTYQFCENDINKFLMLFRKGIYPYEYMDSWNKFNQDKLPAMNNFYSELIMENITNSAYRHAQRVFKTFNNKNLGDYHDLYVQRDVLLLADVFENFRNQCLETYDLDPAYFLTLPALAWQACLKTTKIKLHLITDQEILLMIEEGIGGGIIQVVAKFLQANNKCIKNYDQNKYSLFLQYLDLSSLYAWAMCQKLPHKDFEYCKDLRYINQKCIKNYNEESSEKGFILEVHIKYQKSYKTSTKIYHFCLKRLRLINKQNLHVIFMIKQDL